MIYLLYILALMAFLIALGNLLEVWVAPLVIVYWVTVGLKYCIDIALGAKKGGDR